MSPSRVLLPSANLRDLGGYENTEGRRVRPGALYRSGHMAELTEDEHATFVGLGLRAIVDLRRDDEVAERPTPQFGDETNHHLSVSHGDESFAAAAARISEPDSAEIVLAAAAGYYRDSIAERLERFRPVFDRIIDDAHHPLLFHCTAGKDRTGIVAAAILKFLDVDDETVMADFLLTNQVRAPYADERVEFHRNRLATEQGIDPADVSTHSLEAMRTLMLVDRSFLDATFEAVTTEWGDWHTMRREGLGIDDQRLAAFRSAVLE